MGRKHKGHSEKSGPERGADLTEEALLQEELARAEAEAEAGVGVEPAEEGLAHAPHPPQSPTDQVERLEREVLDWKDRAMRASADFDNYRKRAIRERDEASGRGQAQAFQRIIDVVDDLARVAHLDPATTSALALHEGMLNIERKFMRTLEAAGLERIDPTGQPFDPTTQEAVTMQPASGPDTDNTVGSVFQHGYRYKGVLLRPAKVVVLRWSGDAPAGDGDSA